MNLLVTGGAGFIGSNFVHHVIDRPEVERLVNLDCLTYAGHLENLAGVEKNSKYIFLRADLRDKAAVADAVRANEITHIIHLAAESHVAHSPLEQGIRGEGQLSERLFETRNWKLQADWDVLMCDELKHRRVATARRY